MLSGLNKKLKNLAGLDTATVATGDKVLVRDADDGDKVKTVTAQSIADLGGGGGGEPDNIARFVAQWQTTLWNDVSSGGAASIDVEDPSFGANLTSGATAGHFGGISRSPLATLQSAYAGDPKLALTFNVATAGTDFDIYFGLGDSGANLYSAGSFVGTARHVGFLIRRTSSGDINVYGTHGSGSANSLTASLTTISATDIVKLVFATDTTGTNTDFYYSVNGAALSSATNLSTNYPNGSRTNWVMACGNRNTESTTIAKVYSSTLQYYG